MKIDDEFPLSEFRFKTSIRHVVGLGQHGRPMTFRDVVSKTKFSFQQAPQVGRKSVNRIEEILKENGFDFAPFEPVTYKTVDSTPLIAEVLIVDWNKLQEIEAWKTKQSFVILLSKEITGFVDLNNGSSLVAVINTIASGWNVPVENIGMQFSEWGLNDATIMLCGTRLK